MKAIRIPAITIHTPIRAAVSVYVYVVAAGALIDALGDCWVQRSLTTQVAAHEVSASEMLFGISWFAAVAWHAWTSFKFVRSDERG